MRPCSCPFIMRLDQLASSLGSVPHWWSCEKSNFSIIEVNETAANATSHQRRSFEGARPFAMPHISAPNGAFIQIEDQWTAVARDKRFPKSTIHDEDSEKGF